MKYEPKLHIVLHEPEIPQNAGNIARTCVAIAAKLWLVEPLGFFVDDKHIRRAGLDYWPYLEWETVADWQTLGQKLPGMNPYLFTKGGKVRHTEVAYRTGDVLVFGSESKGLPPALLEQYADRRVVVPMLPQMRSLNLSNTAAIVAYEALRQWDFAGFPRPS